MNRSITIDILRGFAVIIMIFANTAPYFIELTNNNLLRFVFSLAAPIFLIITGYVTQITISGLYFNNKKFLSRVFQILFFAIVIDLLFWKAIPFVTFDILYLITLSQLLLMSLNKERLITAVIFIFIGNLLMHAFFKYRFDIPDLTFDKLNQEGILSNISPIKRYLFDGWFPVFPWMGFVFMGAIGFYYKEAVDFKRNHYLIFGLVVLIIAFFILINIDFPTRDFYLEIWYPATGYTLLIPFSMFLIVMGVISRTIKKETIIIRFLLFMGRNSLFVYVFNSLLIALVFEFHLNNSKVGGNCILPVLIFIIIFSAFLIDRLRMNRIWSSVPKGVKFLLGYQ